MITYVKGQYVNDYNVLYQDAVEALKEYFLSLPADDEARREYEKAPEKLTISNLAEYFGYMKHLTAIDVDKNELKFTKLPLDEENFIVDLNKREIAVPEHFAKNGVGVRGDEIAEIVYFEVDRYFDAIDLNQQEIIIEWINADGQKGYSRPYGQDVDLIPGKIVFGWPISSKVTPKDGQIKFAIRFYATDDTAGSSGVSYSLSTKLQTVKVNMDIDILLEDILNKRPHILADDCIDVIKARAENSERKDHATPGTPVIYYIGEELGAEDGNGVALPANKATVVYVSTPTEDGAPGAVTISAGVYADGDGVTTGSFWAKYKYEVKDSRVREVLRTDAYDALTDEEKAEYDANFLQETRWLNYEEISVADAKAEIAARAANAAGILYYAKEDTNKYRVLTLAQINEMPDEAEAIYRQDYTAIISDVGVYQFVGQVDAGSNNKQTKSDYILVFPPVRPKDVAVGGNTMMEEGADGVYATTLSANMSEFGTELDADLLPPSFVDYENNKELYPFDGSYEWPTYTWYHNPNVKTAIDKLADADWEQMEDEVAKQLMAKEEGFYKCGIVGHLNNHQSEEIISEPYRVTMPASRFTLAIKGRDQYQDNIETITDRQFAADGKPALETAIQYIDGNVVKGLTVVPTLEDERYMDAFTYEWYQYVWNTEAGKDFSVDAGDAIKAIQGIYEPDLKGTIAWPADLLQEGATTNEFVPTKNGIYFCIVTNTYNDDTEVMCSPFMQFNLQQ